MQFRIFLAVSITLLISLAVTAQTIRKPFADIDKEEKVLTLTNGKYEEFFDDDSLQRIGTALININTMKVVKLQLTEDEQRIMDNSATSRFLSMDPLYKEYAELTPYQFASNTPIASIDLDGLEAKIAIAGQGQVGSTHYSTADNNANETWAMMMQVNGFKESTANTGADLLGILKEATTKEGGINTVISFSHAGPVGVYLNSNEGLYVKSSYASSVFKSPLGPRAKDIDDLKKSVDAGDIKFNDNALWIFAGCQTHWGPEEANIAYRLAKDLDVATIGATGFATNVVENGKDTYKWTTTGAWTYTYKVYEMNYYDKDNKLIDTHYAYSKNEADNYNKGFNADKAYRLETNENVQQVNLGKDINLNDLTKTPK